MRIMTREEALELLKEYNKEPFHIEHGETVGRVMRWYADKLGYGDEADFWETVGILHDLDFERWPDQHCAKCQEIIDANQILHNGLAQIEKYQAIVENAKQKLDALPVLKKKIFEQIDEATNSTKEKTNYTGFSYTQSNGLISITDVKVSDQLEAPEFVRGIKKLNYFNDVTFSGYTGTGDGDDPVVISALQLYISSEEVTE